ncbi:MAG: hypothetical protein IPP68_03545 [Elusimicrobia bacterium]|nr:hypothetical protein [Elusimicrobiota bacterium]
MAASFFFCNVLGVYAQEQNFWSARRVAARKMQPPESEGIDLGQEGNMLLSQIPQAVRMDLGSAGGSAISSTPGELAKIPPTKTAPQDWLGKLVTPYGWVRDVYLSPKANAPVVVHIQDAHGIEEAQRNISAMLGALMQERRVNLVGLEGASGSFTLDPYRTYPDSSITKDIADFLLIKGLIAGPEYAGLTLPQAPAFYGAEDSALYEGNVKALKTAFKTKTTLLATLATLRAVADQEKKKTFSEGLKNFDRHFEAYKAQREKLGDYVRALVKTPGGRDGRLDIPNVRLMLNALDWEENLDFKAVETERQRLVEVLVRRLSKPALQDLVARSIDYRTGRMGYGDYHRHLRQVCADNKIRLDDFGQLSSYITYVLLAEKISRNELVAELDQLEIAAQNSLAKTPAETALMNIARDLALLEKMLRHEMAMPDWVAYEKRRPEILALRDRLAALDPTVARLPSLTVETLKPFEDFCSYAVRRNDALVANLLAKMAEKGTTTGVLVAGGFHTEGLTGLLRQKQISYVVVTPKITDVPGESDYLDILAHDPVPLEKLVAGDRIYLSHPIALADATGETPRFIHGAQEVLQNGVRAVSVSAAEALEPCDNVHGAADRHVDLGNGHAVDMVRRTGSVVAAFGALVGGLASRMSGLFARAAALPGALTESVVVRARSALSDLARRPLFSGNYAGSMRTDPARTVLWSAPFGENARFLLYVYPILLLAGSPAWSLTAALVVAAKITLATHKQVYYYGKDGALQQREATPLDRLGIFSLFTAFGVASLAVTVFLTGAFVPSFAAFGPTEIIQNLPLLVRELGNTLLSLGTSHFWAAPLQGLQELAGVSSSVLGPVVGGFAVGVLGHAGVNWAQRRGGGAFLTGSTEDHLAGLSNLRRYGKFTSPTALAGLDRLLAPDQRLNEKPELALALNRLLNMARQGAGTSTQDVPVPGEVMAERIVHHAISNPEALVRLGEFFDRMDAYDRSERAMIALAGHVLVKEGADFGAATQALLSAPADLQRLHREFRQLYFQRVADSPKLLTEGPDAQTLWKISFLLGEVFDQTKSQTIQNTLGNRLLSSPDPGESAAAIERVLKSQFVRENEGMIFGLTKVHFLELLARSPVGRESETAPLEFFTGLSELLFEGDKPSRYQTEEKAAVGLLLLGLVYPDLQKPLLADLAVAGQSARFNLSSEVERALESAFSPWEDTRDRPLKGPLAQAPAFVQAFERTKTLRALNIPSDDLKHLGALSPEEIALLGTLGVRVDPRKIRSSEGSFMGFAARALATTARNTGSSTARPERMAALAERLRGIAERWSVPEEGHLINHVDGALSRHIGPAASLDLLMFLAEKNRVPSVGLLDEALAGLPYWSERDPFFEFLRRTDPAIDYYRLIETFYRWSLLLKLHAEANSREKLEPSLEAMRALAAAFAGGSLRPKNLARTVEAVVAAAERQAVLEVFGEENAPILEKLDQRQLTQLIVATSLTTSLRPERAPTGETAGLADRLKSAVTTWLETLRNGGTAEAANAAAAAHNLAQIPGNGEAKAALLAAGYSPALWDRGIVVPAQDVAPLSAQERIVQVQRQTEQLVQIARSLGLVKAAEAAQTADALDTYAAAEQFVNERILGQRDEAIDRLSRDGVENPEERFLQIQLHFNEILIALRSLLATQKLKDDARARVSVKIQKSLLDEVAAGHRVPGCFNPFGGGHQEMPVAHALESNSAFAMAYDEATGAMIANVVLVMTDQGVLVFGDYNASGYDLSPVWKAAWEQLARLTPGVILAPASAGRARFQPGDGAAEFNNETVKKTWNVIPEAYFDFGVTNERQGTADFFLNNALRITRPAEPVVETPVAPVVPAITGNTILTPTSGPRRLGTFPSVLVLSGNRVSLSLEGNRLIATGPEGREVLQPGESLTLGRQTAAEGRTLRLSGVEVSRKHAALAWSGSEATVENFSPNNTTVDVSPAEEGNSGRERLESTLLASVRGDLGILAQGRALRIPLDVYIKGDKIRVVPQDGAVVLSDIQNAAAFAVAVDIEASEGGRSARYTLSDIRDEAGQRVSAAGTLRRGDSGNLELGDDLAQMRTVRLHLDTRLNDHLAALGRPLANEPLSDEVYALEQTVSSLQRNQTPGRIEAFSAEYLTALVDAWRNVRATALLGGPSQNAGAVNIPRKHLPVPLVVNGVHLVLESTPEGGLSLLLPNGHRRTGATLQFGREDLGVGPTSGISRNQFSLSIVGNDVVLLDEQSANGTLAPTSTGAPRGPPAATISGLVPLIGRLYGLNPANPADLNRIINEKAPLVETVVTGVFFYAAVGLLSALGSAVGFHIDHAFFAATGLFALVNLAFGFSHRSVYRFKPPLPGVTRTGRWEAEPAPASLRDRWALALRGAAIHTPLLLAFMDPLGGLFLAPLGALTSVAFHVVHNQLAARFGWTAATAANGDQGPPSNAKRLVKMSLADFLQEYAKEDFFRPGYFGYNAPAIRARLDEWFGPSGWSIKHVINDQIVDESRAYEFYEEGYYQYFKSHPDELDRLVKMARDVYDTAPSNVASGGDYTKQGDTPARHLQDIAIRNVVKRLGRAFEGTELIQVRGRGTPGEQWAPGNIPIHDASLIRQPEMRNWWKAGSIESFFQSTKIIVLTPHPVAQSLFANHQRFFGKERLFQLKDLAALPWALDADQFPKDAEGRPRVFTDNEINQILSGWLMLMGGSNQVNRDSFLHAREELRQLLAPDVVTRDQEAVDSHVAFAPYVVARLQETGQVPIFLARDALSINEFRRYTDQLNDQTSAAAVVYHPGIFTPVGPNRRNDDKELSQIIKSIKNIMDESFREIVAEGLFPFDQLGIKSAAVREGIEEKFKQKTAALIEGDALFADYANQIYRQFRSSGLPMTRSFVVVDTYGSGKSALFVKSVIEYFATRERGRESTPFKVDVLLGRSNHVSLSQPELSDIYAVDTREKAFLDLYWPFQYAAVHNANSHFPMFGVKTNPTKLLSLAYQSLTLYNQAVRFGRGEIPILKTGAAPNVHRDRGPPATIPGLVPLIARLYRLNPNSPEDLNKIVTEKAPFVESALFGLFYFGAMVLMSNLDVIVSGFLGVPVSLNPTIFNQYSLFALANLAFGALHARVYTYRDGQWEVESNPDGTPKFASWGTRLSLAVRGMAIHSPLLWTNLFPLLGPLVTILGAATSVVLHIVHNELASHFGWRAMTAGGPASSSAGAFRRFAIAGRYATQPGEKPADTARRLADLSTTAGEILTKVDKGTAAMLIRRILEVPLSSTDLTDQFDIAYVAEGKDVRNSQRKPVPSRPARGELDALKSIGGHGTPRFGLADFIETPDGKEQIQWYVEEFVEGQTLHEIKAHGRMDPGLARQTVKTLFDIARHWEGPGLKERPSQLGNDRRPHR